MSHLRYYRVGGHLFALDLLLPLPAQFTEKELVNYAPFQVTGHDGEELLFTLTITGSDNDDSSPEGDRIACFDDKNGTMELYALPDGGLKIHLSAPAGPKCAWITIQPGHRTALARITGTPELRRYALDTALMLLYAFAAASRDTLLLHASAVEYAGRTYLFLGKSGTGKSTHSRLWLENISGTRLLNDDNPVIRVSDGKVMVYGSPWSGKTPCYLDRAVPAGAIVRLSQGPCNRIMALSAVGAYAALLPSCSFMRWDSAMAGVVHRTLSQIAGSVNVYRMECLPDPGAAIMCKNAVTA